MKTQELPTNLYHHRSYEGCLNIWGEKFMVVDTELYNDIKDLGYTELELDDFMDMYEDWVEAR